MSTGDQDSDERMRDYYAARAREYDAIYAKPERQADLRAMERWLPPHFAGRDVLEVACGTGYWTQFLAPTAHSVTGVDASGEVLDIARGRTWGDRVSFEIGDAYELAAWNQECNGAFAGFWFSHVPRAREAPFIAGLNRILAPDSPVVLLDNRFVAGSSSAICDTDGEGNTYQERRLSSGRAFRVLKNFPSAAELYSLLEPLASEVRYMEWRHYWAVSYRTP